MVAVKEKEIVAERVTLTIQQVAARTGLSVHTLRYYEKMGLTLSVYRDPSSKHRRYAESDVQWLQFLACLRATQMPLAQMTTLTQLVREGDVTLPARRQLLEAHQAEIKQRVVALQETVGFLEIKIQYHHALEATNGIETEKSQSIQEEISLFLENSNKKGSKIR
jgi:DNA-binding transcriptional MerR regulator